MTRILYTWIIFLIKQYFVFFSGVKPKIKKRLLGLSSQVVRKPSQPSVLFHCSSAGEYEQISMLIDKIQKHYPTYKMIISFFSPSGIEWMKRKEIQYQYYYLPFDFKKDMNEFIGKIEPEFVVITKNELWYNFIEILANRKIPHFLVAASFSPSHISFKIPHFKKILQSFTRIYTIDKQSEQCLLARGIDAKFVGDPRIDRIVQRGKNALKISKFNRKDEKPIIIYSSLHREDLGVLEGIKDDTKFLHIIVPHEVNRDEVSYFRKTLGDSLDIDSEVEIWKKNVILVDKVGILADLYQYSSFAYVGGGFGKGIHNILEAAIHNNIVFIGPNYKRFPEAIWLEQKSGLIVLSSAKGIVSMVASIQKDEATYQYKIKKMEGFFLTHANINSTLASSIIQNL